MREFVQLFGTNESILSGIAAAIVILGVFLTAARALVATRRRASKKQTTNSPADDSAHILDTDSPSIAVMPFANLSGDSEQDFLADGLTEDIIFGLSRVKQLFVIARNTSFTYKGTTPDAQVISRELGVRYVLEGSVRKVGDRIRITAQLVDARTRIPKWAERFDRKLEEILEIDDEVTDAIVTALQPALRLAEVEHARRASPGDLTAWALVNRAWVNVQSDLGDVTAATEAIESCEQAIALDPNYAFAHAVLSHAQSLLVRSQELDSVKLKADALNSIQRAIDLAPNDSVVQHCYAAVLANLGRTEDCIRAWERAIELDPNNAGARAGLGISMIYRRRAEESLALIQSALKRSPADPLQYHWLGNLALALALTGRTEESIEQAQRSIERRRSSLAYAVLAGSLANRNRLEEAGRAYREFELRQEGLVDSDIARLAGELAPDSQWGKVIENDFQRAADVARLLESDGNS